MIKTQILLNMDDILKTPRHKTLVACIGLDTEQAPRYALFVTRGSVGLYWSVSLENKDGVCNTEWVDASELTKKVDAMINVAKGLCGDIGKEEDEDEDDIIYYCNNSNCPEKGIIVEPLMEEDGTMVCPSCGTPLDFEENEEIEYGRLVEITQILLAYIAEDFRERPEEEFYLELEGLGIEDYEIGQLGF